MDESSQCVEKQNNVYFSLNEIDTNSKQAIIRSEYDYGYYLISYNVGCYSINRYLNRQIVVNLGTDFDLDAWDKIVLQDDDENCDITRVSRVNASTTLEEDENENFDPVYYSEIVPNNTNYIPENVAGFQFDESKNKNFDTKVFGEINSSAALRMCPSKTECKVIKYLNQKTKVDISGGYNNEEWYWVVVSDDSTVLGWMHNSVIDKMENQSADNILTKRDETQGNAQNNLPWYKKAFGFLRGLFN